MRFVPDAIISNGLCLVNDGKRATLLEPPLTYCVFVCVVLLVPAEEDHDPHMPDHTLHHTRLDDWRVPRSAVNAALTPVSLKPFPYL